MSQKAARELDGEAEEPDREPEDDSNGAPEKIRFAFTGSSKSPLNSILGDYE